MDENGPGYWICDCTIMRSNIIVEADSADEAERKAEQVAECSDHEFIECICMPAGTGESGEEEYEYGDAGLLAE